MFKISDTKLWWLFQVMKKFAKDKMCIKNEKEVTNDNNFGMNFYETLKYME